jgi:hypothetical protein
VAEMPLYPKLYPKSENNSKYPGTSLKISEPDAGMIRT